MIFSKRKQKLQLNKVTVSHLDRPFMAVLRAGGTDSGIEPNDTFIQNPTTHTTGDTFRNGCNRPSGGGDESPDA